MISVTVVQTWDIPYFKAVKKLLHHAHFCWVLYHFLIAVDILFLNLFCYHLRVSPDKESSNAELFG
jgi:hypothetical protein